MRRSAAAIILAGFVIAALCSVRPVQDRVSSPPPTRPPWPFSTLNEMAATPISTVPEGVTPDVARWADFGPTHVYAVDLALGSPVWLTNCMGGTYNKWETRFAGMEGLLKRDDLTPQFRAKVIHNYEKWAGMREQWWFKLCLSTGAPAAPVGSQGRRMDKPNPEGEPQ